MDRLFRDGTELFPVDAPVLGHVGEIDGTKITGLIGEERLLPARIGAFNGPYPGCGVVLIDPVDEDDSWISVPPGIIDHLLEDLARIEKMNRLSTPRIPEWIFSVSLHRFHKLIGGGHGDIELVEVAIFLFTLDELENVRVIHPKDAHICSPASPPLFDRFGSCIEDAHEGDRTACEAF